MDFLKYRPHQQWDGSLHLGGQPHPPFQASRLHAENDNLRKRALQSSRQRQYLGQTGLMGTGAFRRAFQLNLLRRETSELSRFQAHLGGVYDDHPLWAGLANGARLR